MTHRHTSRIVTACGLEAATRSVGRYIALLAATLLPVPESVNTDSHRTGKLRLGEADKSA